MVNTSIQDVFYLFEEEFAEKISNETIYFVFLQKIEVMEQKRTTPEFITSLEPYEIFVFGSNLKGMHGGGAAYIAYRKFGAIMGQGVGLQGQSYAIPTMQGGVETIRPYVDEFIQFAKQHQISPLFKEAHEVENIVLPPNW